MAACSCALSCPKISSIRRFRSPCRWLLGERCCVWVDVWLCRMAAMGWDDVMSRSQARHRPQTHAPAIGRPCSPPPPSRTRARCGSHAPRRRCRRLPRRPCRLLVGVLRARALVGGEGMRVARQAHKHPHTQRGTHTHARARSPNRPRRPHPPLPSPPCASAAAAASSACSRRRLA